MNEVIIGSEVRLNELAIEINTINRQASQTVLAAACEIGKRLTEAKNYLPHGKWSEWLKQHVDYSDRTAQQLMRCWEEYGRSTNPQALAEFEGLTLTKAVALLGVDPIQRSELIESGEAEELSTRQLQKRIADLKALSDAKQVRIDELEREAEEPTVTGPSEEQAEELRKAKAERDEAEQRAKSAEQKAQTEEQKARAAERKAEEAERRANEAAKPVPMPEKAIEVVEVVPSDVREELEELRTRLRTAPNVHVIKMRDSYDRILKELEQIMSGLGDLPENDAAPYRAAFQRGLRAMADKLGE